MSAFIMLVGLSASGKSTKAELLNKEIENSVIVSSDELRMEIFGDVNHQESNEELFTIMFKRTVGYLAEGKTVIYDATNVARKKRIDLLKRLPKDVKKIAYYMATPFFVCLHSNDMRERKVPENVIKRQFLNLQIPMKYEGFDEVKIIHTLSNRAFKPKPIDISSRKLSYDELVELFKEFRLFDVIDASHDSKYHSFSISRHIYHVYEHIFDNYNPADKKDRVAMLWASIFHDIGKPFTKRFENFKGDKSRYAHFYGHEHVGAQMAVYLLNMVRFQDSFILEVADLIQNHMRMMQISTDKARDKFYNLVGSANFYKLSILHDADTRAK